MTTSPGSISRERQRDGSYRFRPRLFVEGTRVPLGLYDTREEAEEVLAAALEQRGARSSGTTLRAWGGAWIEDREQSGLVRGARKEASCWRAHVADTTLAAMPIKRIRRQHVVAWIRDLERAENRRSVQTIRHARRLVIGAFEAAIDAGHLVHNPARGARIRPEKRTEDTWTWLTVEEIARLLALPVDERHPRKNNGARLAGHITSKQRSALVVAIYAGLRAGEMWGLRWRDVILEDDRPRLVVRHSRDEATKSGKVREVPLLAPALEALRRWRELAPGVGSALVWPGQGGACHVDGYNAGWPRMMQLAKVARYVRWHDLRHTCASHLVQGTWGRVWTLEEVRDVLGHSSIRQTERYAHLCPGGIHAAARATSGELPETVSGDQRPRRSVGQTLAERTDDIEYTAAEARARLVEDGVDVDGFLARLNDRVKQERERERLRPLLAARERVQARRGSTRSFAERYASWDGPQLEAEVRRRDAAGLHHATGHHNFEKLTVEDMRTLLADQDELDADDE